MYRTKVSNSFAKIEAAVSLQPVCMVSVVAERHQSVSWKSHELRILCEQVCEPGHQPIPGHNVDISPVVAHMLDLTLPNCPNLL